MCFMIIGQLTADSGADVMPRAAVLAQACASQEELARAAVLLANRPMTIFIDMVKTVGNDFEAGLAHLKTLAEKP